MDKVFDNVSLLQTCYPLETIRRCRQRPSSQGKKLLPARFEASNEYPDTASGPRANLDVRTVDQGVIDMASKHDAIFLPEPYG